MGMFDTVKFRCPKCGGACEEQTKSGPCLLKEVELELADPSMISGMGGRRGLRCEHCDANLQVKMINRPMYRVVEVPDDEDMVTYG